MNGVTPMMGLDRYSLGGGQSVAWSRSKDFLVEISWLESIWTLPLRRR
jgi:hypothetical protein